VKSPVSLSPGAVEASFVDVRSTDSVDDTHVHVAGGGGDGAAGLWISPAKAEILRVRLKTAAHNIGLTGFIFDLLVWCSG
jgi:hypothetical protein